MSSIRLCAPSRFRVVGAVSPAICRTAAFTAFRFSDAVAIWDRSSPVCRESCSIAAASILAKVSRDRLCEEHDRLYPEYGFAKHKGYGTAAHMEAIRKYGPCPLHRKTFLKFLDK